MSDAYAALSKFCERTERRKYETRYYLKSPSHLRDAVRALLNLDAHFITITSMDLGNIVRLLYHFDVKGEILTLVVDLPAISPVVDSISDIVAAAELSEREVSEFSEVTFRGRKYAPLFL